jgi:hypothetical protein
MKDEELETAWSIFAGWCGRDLVPAIPAAADTVRAFLADHGSRWTRLDRLEATLEAISLRHQAQGFLDPTNDPIVIEEVCRFGARLLARRNVLDRRVVEVAAFGAAVSALASARARGAQNLHELGVEARCLAPKVLRAALGREPIDDEVEFVVEPHPSTIDEVLASSTFRQKPN